jgi:small subunit ribosomal protein S2
MITNLQTIRQSVKKLERIEKRIAASATGGDLTKKEISLMTKDQVKLDKNLSGVRSMRKPPGLLIVVDPSKEHIAIAEAKKLGIPIMALVDTNCDPDPIDYVIACNDDALKSVRVILSTIASAIIDKKNEMRALAIKGDKDARDEDEEVAVEGEISNELAEKLFEKE